MNNEDAQSNKPYEVDYKKPPEQHQFKKGQSGNPNGRSKKPLELDIPDDFIKLFTNALLEKVSVKKNGKQCEITKNEALVQQLINDAISGPASVRIQITKMLYAMGIPQKAEQRFDQFLTAEANNDLWTPEMEQALKEIEANFVLSDDEVSEKCEEPNQLTDKD